MTIMAAIIRRSDGDNAEALRRRSDSDHGGDQAAVRRRPQVTIIHCSDQAAISHEPMTRRRAGGQSGSKQAAIRAVIRWQGAYYGGHHMT